MYIAASEYWQIVELLAVGGLAGLMGGLLGIGGGLVMIPAMTLILHDRFGPGSFHLYKLAAIAASIIVSLPAAIRHKRAGAVVPGVLRAVLPCAVAAVIVGVMLAGRLFSGEQTRTLRQVFGVCVEIAVAVNVWHMIHTSAGDAPFRDRCPMPSRWALLGASIGLPTGLIAGVLGIGGGIWNVPVQNMFMGVRLRYAIGTSSFIILFVSAVTAVAQSIQVHSMADLSVLDGWWLAAWLGPGAVVGGWLGASLTHRMPIVWLRHVFHALLAISGVRLILG